MKIVVLAGGISPERDVSLSSGSMIVNALAEKCHAALYGHTHFQKMEWRSGILILNPGAVNDGKYAVLNINRLGAIDPELCHL